MGHWLICIDDTDDIGTKGTGEIAEEIAAKLAGLGLGAVSAVTRHQLFVHPDIPYTSHNSAMCFSLVGDGTLEAIRCIAVEHLLAESAPGSDPGLAIGQFESGEGEDIQQQLIQFGQEAKKQVKNKAEAYQLAEQCGISLSEHGGSGDGVIGALAGIGLRLSGNDGRMKGQVSINGEHSQSLTAVNMTVKQLLQGSSLTEVVTLSGQRLSTEIELCLSGKLKAVYLNGQFVLPVYEDNGGWHNATRSQLKTY